MTSLYVIKDRTDANFYKPFVSIHKNEQKAQQVVAQMKSRLSLANQKLISYEPVDVKDFDANKSQVFVVFDKTDRGGKKAFSSMHFDFRNAEKEVQTLKKTVSFQAQKLVYVRPERVD